MAAKSSCSSVGHVGNLLTVTLGQSGAAFPVSLPWLLSSALLLMQLLLLQLLVLHASLELLQSASLAAHQGATWPLSPQHFVAGSVAMVSYATQLQQPVKWPV